MSGVDRLRLPDLIAWRAEATPDALFAVDELDRALSFSTYHALCGEVAEAFAAQGVVAGDAVAWMLPTWLEAYVVAGALARIGAVQVPLVPILREREVEFILRRAGAVRLIVPGAWRAFDYPAFARGICERTGLVSPTIVERAPTASALLASLRRAPRAETASPPTRPAPRPDGGCDRDERIDDDVPCRWIFFTSGTTADPKGVRHADRTVAAAARRLNDRFAMTPADRNALVFPVTHIGGISWLMGGLMAGYAQILVERFEPDEACAVLARHGVTIAGSGPAFWMAYVAAQQRRGGTRLFARLRALVGGGAAKPPTLEAQVRAVLGVPLVTGYGSTECPGVAHNGVADDAETLRSDGHALADAELRIVGPDGAARGPGEEGEIVARGPMRFLGYLDPRDDAAALDAAGWFHTGDLGALDARGRLHVTGRLKDIIIRKGENISAKEVEDVLFYHPAIVDVAAIALPDRERGELCCAVVVAAAGSAAPDLEAIRAHCVARGLARQKIPERLEVVDRLPRNAVGKVMKRELVTRYG
ncbi:MAG: AMP-binding protein [Myxococcota bacterium]